MGEGILGAKKHICSYVAGVTPFSRAELALRMFSILVPGPFRHGDNPGSAAENP